jgi:cytochrome c553
MKLIALFFVCFTTSFSVMAADVEKGKALYQKCVACHGVDGYGKKSQAAPLLAGQYDWYIADQIRKIKNQERKNANATKMYPFVKNLTDGEIEDLAAYIQTLVKK